MPQLTPQQAAHIEALGSDPDYIAYMALRDDRHSDRVTAICLWTTAAPADVDALLGTPAQAALLEVLASGLARRAGRHLGAGELLTHRLLADMYCRADGDPWIDVEDWHGRLRLCERCHIVTRGKRHATLCPDCGHRNSHRIDDGMPVLSPCPECYVRPVNDRQARCEDCAAARVRTKQARKARERRARERRSSAS